MFSNEVPKSLSEKFIQDVSTYWNASIKLIDPSLLKELKTLTVVAAWSSPKEGKEYISFMVRMPENIKTQFSMPIETPQTALKIIESMVLSNMSVSIKHSDAYAADRILNVLCDSTVNTSLTDEKRSHIVYCAYQALFRHCPTKHVVVFRNTRDEVYVLDASLLGLAITTPASPSTKYQLPNY